MMGPCKSLFYGFGFCIKIHSLAIFTILFDNILGIPPPKLRRFDQVIDCPIQYHLDSYSYEKSRMKKSHT